jgi:hypothetical protein
LKDFVEVFFREEEGVTVVEDAVARNVPLFEAKFKACPLPKRFAPEWAVGIRSDVVDVGGTKVEVSICRPSVAASDSLTGASLNVLSTLEPRSLSAGEDFTYSMDGASLTLKGGSDFWLSTAAKVRATKAVAWM